MKRDQLPEIYHPAEYGLLFAGDWWGTANWLFLGNPPRAARYSCPLRKAIKDYLSRTRSAVELGPPRFSQGGFAERAIDGVVGYTVDAEFVLWAECHAEVDQWHWSPNDERGKAPVVVGLRKGRPVAVLAPREAGH